MTLSRASSALMIVASGIRGLDVLATLSSSATLLVAVFFLRPLPEVDEGAFDARGVVALALVFFVGLVLRRLRLTGAASSMSALTSDAGVSEFFFVEKEPVLATEAIRLSLGVSGAASMRAETCSERL